MSLPPPPTTSSTTTSTPAPPTTTPPPPDTTTSTTTTSETPTSTTTTPATTESSTTSTPPVESTSAAPPPSTTAPPPTSSVTSVFVTTSGNVQVTQTVLVSPSVVTGPAPSSSATEAPSPSFFENKGAVAGTFTAVGVVILVAIGFLVAAFLKKRRQKKFDREVDEAALEAATAPAPTFLDDDDDAYTQHGVQSNYTGPYSESTSHGTFSQPPLSAENYPMAEMNNIGVNRHNSVGPGQIFGAAGAAGAGAAGAGAAGIGVTRTRSMMGAPPVPDANTPYAAFAGPGYNQRQSQQPGHYGGEAYAAANLQRGPSDASYNPYAGQHEVVPPLPTGTPVNRTPSLGPSLVNPHDRQASPPPPPPPLANPHSPPVAPPAGRVFSGGDFGGASTPEFANAPIHNPQTAEQGRWSDYNEDDTHRSDESAGRPPPPPDESDDEEEEEKPKVFKITN